MKFYFLITVIFFSCIHLQAQIIGCTDPLANNYNPAANVNDGSCTYNSASVSPVSSFNLNSTVIETSGLIRWENYAWTQNDNTDTNIYALDTTDGSIIQAYPLNSVVNYDWEEISQDSNYIYVGDFGNNGNGNRTDLHILRVEKNSLLANTPITDTIWFSYSDQTDFTPTGSNNTDFDCEAFIVATDSIYLFTKQWVGNKTKIYSMPKIPGTYTATFRYICDVQGLITGATYLESKRLVVLCGYSSLLQPFLYLLYDFNDNMFVSGNKRKIGISLPFHQTEGIATTDGKKYFISNESFVNPPFIDVPQKFHIFDLSSYLGNYLDSIQTGINQIHDNKDIVIYPNPAYEYIIVETVDSEQFSEYTIRDIAGKQVMSGKISNGLTRISTENLKAGTYFFYSEGLKIQTFKIIKN